MVLPTQTKVHEVRDQVDLGQPSYSQHLGVLRMEKDIIFVYASKALGEAIPERVTSVGDNLRVLNRTWGDLNFLLYMCLHSKNIKTISMYCFTAIYNS